LEALPAPRSAPATKSSSCSQRQRPNPDEPSGEASSQRHGAHVTVTRHRNGICGNHNYLGEARRHLLASYAHHFNGHFWKGSFSFIEHFPKGMRYEPKDLHYFYDTFPTDREPEYIFDLTPQSSNPDDGRCLWVNQYRLPSEEDAEALTATQT
jgi:hypothetical protein